MKAKFSTPNAANRRQRAGMTAAEVRERYAYDALTGVFVYRQQRGPKKAGESAGTVKPDGRRVINVNGVLCFAHRLAWLYQTGQWPKGEIDHRDGNPSNNRFDNLRDVTAQVNKQNQRRAPVGKKYSPLLGAQWCKQAGKWKTSIRVDGRQRFLGFFETDADASAAYVVAKRALHEGCTL